MGLLSIIWVSLRNASMIYYFKYYVGHAEKASAFMVVGTIFTILGVISTTQITKIIGSKKRAYIILTFLNAILMAIFYFAGPSDFVLMYATHIIGSYLGGPLFPLTWSMYADTADYAEWKFGRRATGLVFSAATFAQKFGWTIGGAFAGWILSFYGFQANVEQTLKTLTGIKLMMSFLPSIGCILTILAALFYNLDAKLQHRIETELIQRKMKEAEGE